MPCSQESACQCRKHRFGPWIWKIPWRRKRQSTLVFLPGESHGQRSLAAYIVYGVSNSRIQLKRLSMHACMDCSPPGLSVHGIFQARMLEWIAFSFSMGSSQPRNQTQASCIDRLVLYQLSCKGSPASGRGSVNFLRQRGGVP